MSRQPEDGFPVRPPSEIPTGPSHDVPSEPSELDPRSTSIPSWAQSLLTQQIEILQNQRQISACQQQLLSESKMMHNDLRSFRRATAERFRDGETRFEMLEERTDHHGRTIEDLERRVSNLEKVTF